MKKLLSYGNSKLPTTTAVFNLPARITCPGCTAECRAYCYARKSERMYSNVLPSRMSKLAVSAKPDFTDRISQELTKSGRKTVRIHESGDFYSQDYLDKWFSIARFHPDVQFYSYTKSMELDFSDRPNNFRVIASKQGQDLDGIATVVDKGQTGDGFHCPGDCKTCSYCSNTKSDYKRLYFTKH